MRGENETIMNVKLESLWPSNAATCSRALRRRAWTNEEIRTVRKMAGTTTALEIAKEIGRPYDSVKSLARKRGIDLRQYGEKHPMAKYPDSAVECSRRLHEKGWSAPRISKMYGWPEAVVKTWIYYIARKNDPVKLTPR